MDKYDQYIGTIASLPEMDETSIENAEKIFELYRTSGTIRDDVEFNDDTWYTTNQIENVGLHFNLSIGTYNKYYKKIFSLEFEEFVRYVKAFVCAILGSISLKSLSAFLRDIKKLVSTPATSVCGDGEFSLKTPSIVIDFLSILPNASESEDINDLIESAEYYLDAMLGCYKSQQRSLAEFDTYFLFNDILDDYWDSALSEKDRLFFFPIYLWWKLTGTIPQRPREFLLMPRDCLTQNEKGEYFLKIRRNRIKGKYETKIVDYTIDGDYSIEEIKIPFSLAAEIENYIFETTDYESTDIDTLLITDPHYAYFGLKKYKRSRYLTYVNLSTALRQFYKDVIQNIYGYTIVYNKKETEHLNDKEICYIHLGDTRHIAMINIIAEGGSIVTAAMLAGHASIYTSGHYYTNIRNLLVCKTYKEQLRISGKTSTYAWKPLVKTNKSSGLPVQNSGCCYSEKYKNGDYSDCINAIGPNSELGYCPSCGFHREKNVDFYTSDEVYLRNLEDDCKELEYAVQQLSSHRTYPEDVGQALLKIQSSAINYENYLKEKELCQKGNQ